MKTQRFRDDSGLGIKFVFQINYGQLPEMLASLQQINELERLTPPPLVRPEFYVGSRGSVNPRVFGEKVDVELSIIRR